MFGIPVGLLIKIGAGIAVAVVLGFAWNALTGHYEQIGADGVQAAWDKDKAVRNKAIADQTNLWNEQRLKTETANHERDQARQQLFDALKPLPPAVAAVRVPGVFLGVLDSARRAANASGPASEPAEAAAPASADTDSTLGTVADWFTTVAEIHAECRDRVASWVKFYRGLQTGQPKVAP